MFFFSAYVPPNSLTRKQKEVLSKAHEPPGGGLTELDNILMPGHWIYHFHKTLFWMLR